jgi:hypothetical protein
MAYGYYTPLTDLKEKPSYLKSNGQIEASIALDQKKSHAPFTAAPIIPSQTLKTKGAHSNLQPVKGSYCNKSTTLKLAALTFSLFSLGIIFLNLSGKSLPSPQDGGHETNGSSSLTTHNPIFEVLSHSLEATATLGQPIADLVTQGFGKGVDAYNGAKAALVANYYGITKELEEVHLTQADYEVIAVRDKYPSYFESRFIQKVLGGSNSATAKSIILAVSKGETSTPFQQLCFLASKGVGVVKCPLSLIKTPEALQENTVGTPISLKEYVGGAYNGLKKGYEEKEYENYLKKFKEKQAKVDLIKRRVQPRIFDELEKAHFAQCASASDLVNNNFMYSSEDAPTNSDFSALANPKTERSSHNTHVTRNEYLPKTHGARARFYVSELQKNGNANLLISRYIWSSHEKGEAKSVWDKYSIGCSYYPIDEEVHCTSVLKGIDHAFGTASYSIRERMITPKCSLITEKLKSPLKTIEDTRAINPNKTLPIILSQIVDSERLVENIKSSFWSAVTGKTDAVVAFPMNLPTGPKTCEELDNIDNPKPQVTQS